MSIHQDHASLLPTKRSPKNFFREGGGGGGKGGGILDFFENPHSKKDEQVNVIEKLVFGEYSSLSEMATDPNSGQQSDMLEKNLYRQMPKLLREDLHSLQKK